MAEPYITVVSGLPRSGTSMIMKMIEAGGMEVITDKVRQQDEDNPNGYYELEAAKAIERDTSWLPATQGKVFKMVSALLRHLPGDFSYRIIFMRRNLKEMIASQKKMLHRGGKDVWTDGFGDAELLFTKHLREMEIWLGEQSNMRVLHLDYGEVLREPAEAAKMINQFLDNILNATSMCAVVDRTLYRNRMEAGEKSFEHRPAGNSDLEKELIAKNLRQLGYM